LLREKGLKVGLFRPVTLFRLRRWRAAARAKHVLVAELDGPDGVDVPRRVAGRVP
jgi:hypothetical protein